MKLLLGMIAIFGHVYSMTVSIIVPCHYVHFPLVPELLERIANQTMIPDEVVVSLSESSKVPEETIRVTKEQKWPFLLKILCSEGKLSAGQNRNVACDNSSGEILITQDADDIPHPQRIEIIKYLFESYPIDHLMHFWILPNEKLTHYDGNFFEDFLAKFNNYESAVNYYEEIPSYGHVTNGNIALKREVFNQIRWPDLSSGEDEAFNRAVYQTFKNPVVFKAPLLIYRNQLSSFHSPSLALGNLFRSDADFIIDEVNLPFSPENVRAHNKIFVQTTYLDRFFQHYHPRIHVPYILITHNSDLTIPGSFGHMLESDKIIAWLGINVKDSNHPKLHSLDNILTKSEWLELLKTL